MPVAGRERPNNGFHETGPGRGLAGGSAGRRGGHLAADVAQQRGHGGQVGAEDGGVDLDEGPVCVLGQAGAGLVAEEADDLDEPDDGRGDADAGDGVDDDEADCGERVR